MSEEIKEVQETVETTTVEAAAEETTGKKKRNREEILEIVVAILLAFTALATAWASWIGSLHGGNMSTNYTKSNNLAAEGNASWNEASQSLMQDMQVWNLISDAQVEIMYAQTTGDEDKAQEAAYKIQFIAADNVSATMAELIKYDFSFGSDEIINWVMTVPEASTTPFGNAEFVESYYTEARASLAESDALLKEGQQDNTNGDTFNLVTVIYSVVLFLLGIAGTFKRIPNRFIIVIVGGIGFLVATIYMLTIPMPTGFNLGSFFGA